MGRPDPYGDWVLFGGEHGEGARTVGIDEELLAAAREAWPHISDLQSYLIGAFHHRFNRLLKREQRRLETIELLSNDADLERIESALDTTWVEELEKAIAVRQIANHMDGWTRKALEARQYGYSWREIGAWSGLSEQTVKKKFEYGVEKTRRHIVRFLKGRKTKGPRGSQSDVSSS